ncbi:MAG: ABC transporter substrate-binding protein [Deltaproteobacteria bacterium]|nr:ABC transporter substrate-binding protein [Deltaproteobacteria bacterium]
MEAPSRRGAAKAVPRRSILPGKLPGVVRTFVVPAALVFLLAAPPVPSLAAGPTDQVRGAINAVTEILNRPDLKGEAKTEERRALLRKRIVPVFDFEGMAKRSLGIHWKKRTPQEREEFVKAFRDVIENSYLGKIEAYKGETIDYVKEKIDLPYAEVDTLVVTTKGQEYPVDYLMLREGDRWRIYDVVIEGISLVNNYRSQFGEILRRSSFDELMKKLRAAAARTRKT